MNKIPYSITLDINKEGTQVFLPMRRGDTNRIINISLMCDGKPYAISKDCTAFFTALKATKNEIYDACVIDYENNTIVYDISRENDNGDIVSQVTAAVGEVKCQIKLIGNDGGIITAPTFSIVVGDTLYSEMPIVEDSTEFTALTTYIATLEKRIADGEFNGPQGEQGPQGVSGVYVGSGDMPEDCNVQIDPDGAVMVVDTKLSTTSTNPVQNKAIAQKFNEIITKNGTVISTIADYAEIGEWSDGNPDNEDRTGYFVSIDPTVPGPEIKIAASTEDVRGAIMRNPGFSANATKDKFDANGELSPKYAYVGIMGLVPIIDKGRCTINQKCMPDDDGTAIPANSDFGYQVADRIDENTVLVVIEPNADAINRIYAELAKIGGGGGSVEIVDNLTSYDTDKALSANMGRQLSDNIDNHRHEMVQQVDSNTNNHIFYPTVKCMTDYVGEEIGDIETVLDGIITIQNNLIGGGA